MTVAVKTPTLMTRTVTGERSAETRKEKSFPVPPKAAEKMAEMAAEKMAIPPILTTRTAEGKSAETRKEKSFPVPPKTAEKMAIPPILTTRMAEGKSAETRKEKSFPVLEKAVKTPILMTRTGTGERSPEQVKTRMMVHAFHALPAGLAMVLMDSLAVPFAAAPCSSWPLLM
jgi:hypothetical protein